VEICIAVADWARGLTTSVLDVPGGEGTGATRRMRTKHVRDTLYRVYRQHRVYRRHRVYRTSPSGSTDGSTGFGRGAGMVVGWG
jgi:hypothetical protein